MLGVRESRRIIGEYTLTLDDVMTGRSFDDAIALSGDSIDIHGKTKSVYIMSSLPTQIPFRCLIPKQAYNLLVAGRCLSAERSAHAAVRVMPPCFAMGQAAGTASGMAALAGCTVRDIDAAKLRTVLIDDGVYLG